MSALSEAALQQQNPVSFFRSGACLRSRSVSTRVLTGVVQVPAPPARLVADWQRDISGQLALEAGDVESLSLPRSRSRWPDYRLCVQALSDWAEAFGLPPLLGNREVALMACRGARYHHDGLQYGANAFCNLFLSDEQGLDLHFPAIDLRIPLVRGTAVVFDTCQPHGVVRRGRSGFDAGDFPAESACDLVFLTWELALEDPRVHSQLGIRLDVSADAGLLGAEPQVRIHGLRSRVCPASGQWQADE